MTRALPLPTARLVDRLARRAHAFHRFAHHPLCQRYAAELIPLGRRTRVCRGCASAALGALAGACCALGMRPAPSTVFAAGALGVTVLLTSLVMRLPKWLGRAAGFAVVSCTGVGCLLSSERGLHLLAISLVAFGLGFSWLYRQRGPDRGPCRSCPERLAPGPCSGLRPIVQRERAFRRLAQRYIDAAAKR